MHLTDNFPFLLHFFRSLSCCIIKSSLSILLFFIKCFILDEHLNVSEFLLFKSKITTRNLFLPLVFIPFQPSNRPKDSIKLDVNFEFSVFLAGEFINILPNLARIVWYLLSSPFHDESYPNVTLYEQVHGK